MHKFMHGQTILPLWVHKCKQSSPWEACFLTFFFWIRFTFTLISSSLVRLVIGTRMTGIQTQTCFQHFFIIFNNEISLTSILFYSPYPNNAVIHNQISINSLMPFTFANASFHKHYQSIQKKIWSCTSIRCNLSTDKF